MKALLTGLAIFCWMAGYSQSGFTVHFDFNRYSLTEAARLQLDSFLLAEKENLPTTVIQFSGHCDAIGSDSYNDKLSRKRIISIKQYLLNNGILAVNIGDQIAHGKRKPLNQNKTEEERLANRRVEISFFKVVTTELPGVTTLKEKLADSTIKAGTNIVLRNINFVGGMHQFLPESKPMLEELLNAMTTYPTLIIRIDGHICCEATKDDGLDGETGIYNLSEARAKAVRDYLLANNVAPDRVSYKGFGHSMPLYPYPEKTEDERVLNRRVEIKIIRK